MTSSNRALKRQLKRWVNAGILDEERAQKIESFEQKDQAFSVGSWILGLGIFAIGVGIVALVASNWEGIPALAKIIVDLGLLGALAFAILRFHGHSDKAMHFELGLGLMFFLTLASLALVGQIYQVDAKLEQTLLTWLLVTTPLMLLAKSSYLASGWALLCTGVYLAYIPSVASALDAQERIQEGLTIAYVFSGPLWLRAMSVLPWFSREFPAHTKALRVMANATTILGAIVCSFPWYISNPSMPQDSFLLCVGLTGLTVLIAMLFKKKLWPQQSASVRWIQVGLWACAWLSLSLGFATGRADSYPALAALFQFTVLTLLISWSLKAELQTIFRILVGLACLRVLIVYFEVFGTLLDTGLALITGGIITIGMAALWRVLVRRLTGATQ